MICGNVTNFGQNIIAPKVFLAGTPMEPINDIALKRNTIFMLFERLLTLFT